MHVFVLLTVIIMMTRARGEVGAKDIDDCVIRISNLSEDSVENDVRDLVSRFGEVSRVVTLHYEVYFEFFFNPLVCSERQRDIHL